MATIGSFAPRFHVLLVDHDVRNLMHMKKVLEMNAYRVTPEDSTIAALSMILEKPNQYDIVIVEIAMPNIDGFRFLEQVQVQNSSAPVIILMTENVEPGMVQKALSRGASCVFKKPIAEHDLVDIWHYVFIKRLEASELKDQIGSFCALLKSKILKLRTQAGGNTRDNADIYDGNRGVTNIGGRERRRRMVWTRELQRKFGAAVIELGGQTNAKPQQILRLMNDPNLTLRRIANYLQKCRAKAKRSCTMVESILMSDSMPQLDGPNLWMSDSMPQLNVPNLWSGNGEGSTDGLYSSVLTTQDLDDALWEKVFSEIMGNQSTFPMMPNWDFFELGSPSSASANLMNSMEPMQNLSNDQQQKLWDLPSSSNIMGGLNTHDVGSSSYMPVQEAGMGLNTNVRSSPTTTAYGQGQTLGISPYLSSNTGDLNNEQSLHDSQEAQKQDVSIDWESLTQEAGVTEGSDVLSCSKPQELETWCLDDLTALLGDNAKYEE